MSGIANSLEVMALVAIPSQVVWSYSVGAAIFAIGLATMFVRGDWQRTRGLDKLILFGPLFYATPLGAFGTEHFTLTAVIASIVPPFVPWHMFWAYFVGACFIAAALSMVTGIQARLSASLLALTFFLFVMMMDVPALVQEPRNRITLTLALRELTFSSGALAFAVSLSERWRNRETSVLATIARYVVAIAALFYSFEQFKYGAYVPGVPLDRLTPTYIWGHSTWTYVAAVGYAITGIMLLIGKSTRVAAAWLGLTVLFVELVVYVPIGIVERASLDQGLNYVFDTLMFCGAVFLLAGAMPREELAAERSQANIMETRAL